MDKKEEVLSLIRSKGPVIPVQISKILGTNIIIASAYLSELCSKGILKISKLKVGGSPLYFLPGQEPRLQDFADRLHEKERRAFELLKSRKLLKDSEQQPVVRYALRQIRDFAKPIEVKIKAEKELFWRWYLAPMNQIESLIRQTYLAKQQTLAKPVVKMPEPPKEKPLAKSEPLPTGFLTKVESFFEERKISIGQSEIIKKAKHAWYMVTLPSAIGNLKYYAEAKSKRKITVADLSEAIVRASNKRIPLLFITDGKLGKKTEEKLGNEFSSITIRQL